MQSCAQLKRVVLVHPKCASVILGTGVLQWSTMDNFYAIKMDDNKVIEQWHGDWVIFFDDLKLPSRLVLETTEWHDFVVRKWRAA